MGGFGSGRYGGRPTIEDARELNLGKLIRDGLLQPGVRTGTITWRSVMTGEEVASIGYESDMREDRGEMCLKYAVTRNGEHERVDHLIRLEATPQPFGGRRWWFICQRTGLRVGKLYLPAGATKFASRHAYQLGYKCQRETAFDRACRRAWKLRERLDCAEPIGDWVPRPRGMHAARYERELARIEAADAAVDAHLARYLSRLPAGDEMLRQWVGYG